MGPRVPEGDPVGTFTHGTVTVSAQARGTSAALPKGQEVKHHGMGWEKEEYEERKGKQGCVLRPLHEA